MGPGLATFRIRRSRVPLGGSDLVGGMAVTSHFSIDIRRWHKACVGLARGCVIVLRPEASAPWRAVSKTPLKPRVPLRPSCAVPHLTYRQCNPGAVDAQRGISRGGLENGREECATSCLTAGPPRGKTTPKPPLFRRLTDPDSYGEGGARDPTVPQAALQVEGLRRAVGAYPPLGRLRGSQFEMQRLVALFLDLPRLAAAGRFEEYETAGIAPLPPVDHHATTGLGAKTEFQNRAKTVLGIFVEDALLAPRLAAVGGQQHKRILRQRKKLLPGGPPGFAIHELEMVETSAANARVYLSPRAAGIIAAQQDRVKSHRDGMNVTRCEKPIARRRGGGQFQKDWAGRILGAVQARPLYVIRCARERQHHGFARVFENYRRRSHRQVASRHRRLILGPGARPGHSENEAGKPQLYASQIVA